VRSSQQEKHIARSFSCNCILVYSSAIVLKETLLFD
jgi:hypothetical protein